MKLSTQSIAQILATIAQGLNLAFPVLPAGRGQMWGAVALSSIQGILGIMAHFSNPDGTTARVAYSPLPSPRQ